MTNFCSLVLPLCRFAFEVFYEWLKTKSGSVIVLIIEKVNV